MQIQHIFLIQNTQNGGEILMFIKRKSMNELQQEQLLEDIRKTKLALDTAHSNFDNALDPDLIDCCIYELNAVQKRYAFLLKQAEQTNLSFLN